MTTPPPQEPGLPDPSAPASPATEPVSLDKPVAAEPFDPYRFGPPDHPVPPEYAPPGYRPPPTAMPPGPPPQQQPNPYGYAAYPPPGQPGQLGGQPGQPGQLGQPGPWGQPGQPGQYPYPPPTYLTQYPPPKTGNGRATAGLVLGIVSIVFFWLPVFDAIAVVLGLIFGILGLKESGRTGFGRGQAIAGIVCAAIGAVLAIVTIVIFARVQPCLHLNSGSPEFNTCVRHRL